MSVLSSTLDTLATQSSQLILQHSQAPPFDCSAGRMCLKRAERVILCGEELLLALCHILGKEG